jgi:transposase-like protein
MSKISYAGYRFPAEIIQQAIWLYLRFTLSFRDVEDLLAERGISVSYETVRRWMNHFGPKIAADLRKRRPKPHTTWHLDEVYLRIDGRMVYLWRAVDAEGEVLDVLVQTRRNKRAALKLMRKLLKKYGFVPAKLVTDDLRSYRAETTSALRFQQAGDSESGLFPQDGVNFGVSASGGETQFSSLNSRSSNLSCHPSKPIAIWPNPRRP